MKKYYMFVITALAMTLVLPVAIHAQEQSDDNVTFTAGDQIRANGEAQPIGRPPVPLGGSATTNIGGKVTTGVPLRGTLPPQRQDGRPFPGMMGSTTASTSLMMRGENGTTIRDRMRADIQEKMTQAQNNGGLRNGALEMRREMMASTTGSTTPRMMRAGIEFRQDLRVNMGNAIRDEIGNVGKNLHNALNNLKQVRTRINSAITAGTAKGKDMTAAKASLAIADTKIQLAATAIATFDAQASSSTTVNPGDTASSTVRANLANLRSALKNARQALQDARQSLMNVVKDIAKALGVKLQDDQPASSSPESIQANESIEN